MPRRALLVFLSAIPMIIADMKDIENCARDNNVDVAELSKREMTTEMMEQMPLNELCFVKCINKVTGLIKDDDTFEIDVVRELIPEDTEEQQKKNILECIEKVGKINSCEDILKAHHCVPPSVGEKIVASLSG